MSKGKAFEERLLLTSLLKEHEVFRLLEILGLVPGVCSKRQSTAKWLYTDSRRNLRSLIYCLWLCPYDLCAALYMLLHTGAIFSVRKTGHQQKTVESVSTELFSASSSNTMHVYNRVPYSSKNNMSFQDLLLPTCEFQDVKQEQRQFSVNTKNMVKPHDQEKHRA